MENSCRTCQPWQAFHYSLVVSDGGSPLLHLRQKRFLSGISIAGRKSILAACAVVSLIVLTLCGTSATDLGSSSSRYLHFGSQSRDHPVKHLFDLANDQLQSLNASQSSTLQAAVKEYQLRYGLPPPPHFDRWYDFAVQHDTQLMDEFDTIFDSLELFWGMTPAVIRERTRQTLDRGNGLLRVEIRDGQVSVNSLGQDDYQGPALRDMISKFSEWLPDMDLAFNFHDEARVIIPHEDTSRLLVKPMASMTAARATETEFTQYNESSQGQYLGPIQNVQFNNMDHQQTFWHSSMSCPPDSPSRNLEEMEDASTGFTYQGLTFIDSVIKYSDICFRPSARSAIGLFSSPNVFSVTHDLVPIFTPSRPSTFHDIIYPSYYYYKERTSFDEGAAVPWEEKAGHLYWTGLTSGGHNEGESWKSLLRQSILIKLAAEGTTRVLSRDAGNGRGKLMGRDINRTTIQDRWDAHFMGFAQCDEEDCEAMRQYFGQYPHDPQEEAYKNRYLLDMDGNAFSGRFYTLLRIFSLPFTLTHFREWHFDRVFPWTHYVPVSSTTDEYTELIRYFEAEDEGQEIAKKIALQGREWAGLTVTPGDMETYMFRLLLEYGRLVDDNRVNIGFVA